MATSACSHKGCAGGARFRPIWLLAFQDRATRHRITLDIAVCEEHRREMQSLFCSTGGQRSLALALTKRLRATPDWKRSRIWFQDED
jgi:hypothetical protein